MTHRFLAWRSRAPSMSVLRHKADISDPLFTKRCKKITIENFPFRVLVLGSLLECNAL
jgi:hypothetical protein